MTAKRRVKRTHRDVEYAVDDCSSKERIFRSFDKAAAFAVNVATTGRENVSVDILCWSESGARFLGMLDRYREDPEASVLARIAITAEDIGRVA